MIKRCGANHLLKCRSRLCLHSDNRFLLWCFYRASLWLPQPAKTITDADYADDLALLANASTQAETLLHCLEQAAADIGLHVNAHKTEYMRFNQTSDISTLNGISLSLVDKFTYLGSSVTHTHTHTHTHISIL